MKQSLFCSECIGMRCQEAVQGLVHRGPVDRVREDPVDVM
jgi:hypothetical protein